MRKIISSIFKSLIKILEALFSSKKLGAKFLFPEFEAKNLVEVTRWKKKNPWEKNSAWNSNQFVPYEIQQNGNKKIMLVVS